MNPQSSIRTTQDGSHTLKHESLGETYHSTFGAIQESRHIFIDACLEHKRLSGPKLEVFEMGFGTGLNALLSLLWTEEHHIHINYIGLEAYPLDTEVLLQLNYPLLLNTDKKQFLELHKKRSTPQQHTRYFQSKLVIAQLEQISLADDSYDVILFDAFSPEVQPELWTADVFARLYSSLKPGGCLSTYSCKGQVKRAMKSAGFQLEKLPGPPGKREFLRASK